MIPMALQGYIWFDIERARLTDHYSRCGLSRSWGTGDVGGTTRSMYMSEGALVGGSRFAVRPIRVDPREMFVVFENRTIVDNIEIENVDAQVRITNVRMIGR